MMVDFNKILADARDPGVLSIASTADPVDKEATGKILTRLRPEPVNPYSGRNAEYADAEKTRNLQLSRVLRHTFPRISQFLT